MRTLRRLLFAITLALVVPLIPPVVAPFAATAAQAAIYATTTDGVLVYWWAWVPMPGQPAGGQWVLVNVTPAIGV